MTDVDPEVLEVFREEAGERLDRMVEALLSLETDRFSAETRRGEPDGEQAAADSPCHGS